MGESEPACLPHSFIILAPRRTHTLTGLYCHPCTCIQGHTGAQCVLGSHVWPPTHCCGPGTAWCLSPAPQHTEQFLYRATPARSMLGGNPLFWGADCSMMSCTPIPACLCFPIPCGGLGATHSCQSTFPSLLNKTSGVGRDGFKRGQGIPSHPNQKGEHIPPLLLPGKD